MTDSTHRKYFLLLDKSCSKIVLRNGQDKALLGALLWMVWLKCKQGMNLSRSLKICGLSCQLPQESRDRTERITLVFSVVYDSVVYDNDVPPQRPAQKPAPKTASRHHYGQRL